MDRSKSIVKDVVKLFLEAGEQGTGPRRLAVWKQSMHGEPNGISQYFSACYIALQSKTISGSSYTGHFTPRVNGTLYLPIAKVILPPRRVPWSAKKSKRKAYDSSTCDSFDLSISKVLLDQSYSNVIYQIWKQHAFPLCDS